MKIIATFLLVIGLTSCSAPKATVLAEAPVNVSPSPKPAPAESARISSESPKPKQPLNRGNGLRLPDMLALPQDEQLRSAPNAPKEGNATVIVRPPEE